MRKMGRHIFLITGLSLILSATAIFAQDLSEKKADGEYDLIIGEALDQIEKNIDQPTMNEELSVEPEISETPGIEIEKDIPVEDQDLESDLEEAEVDLEPIVAAEEEGADKAMETETTGFEEPGPVPTFEEDHPEDVMETKVIPLVHAEASSIIESLAAMKSPMGEVTFNEEDRTLVLKDTPEKLEEMSAFVREIDVLLETAVFPLRYVKAQDIFVNIEQALTKNVGQAQIDEESNSIIVTDTPAQMGNIKEIIQESDRFNVEIVIAARILKIILNEEHMSGVDWEAIVSEYKKMTISQGPGGGEKPLSLGTVSQEDYDILLEALDTVGSVQTVSEEETKAENEATAEVAVMPTETEGEVQFYLTPTVKKDEPLKIGITTEKNDPKQITLQMNNGETIVIGGLFEDVMVASTWKIPLLGDLPLLGFVFRNEGEELRKAEIITFLTVEASEKD